MARATLIPLFCWNQLLASKINQFDYVQVLRLHVSGLSVSWCTGLNFITWIQPTWSNSSVKYINVIKKIFNSASGEAGAKFITLAIQRDCLDTIISWFEIFQLLRRHIFVLCFLGLEFCHWNSTNDLPLIDFSVLETWPVDWITGLFFNCHLHHFLTYKN